MSLGMKLNIQLTSKRIDGIFIKLVTYSQGNYFIIMQLHGDFIIPGYIYKRKMDNNDLFLLILICH